MGERSLFAYKWKSVRLEVTSVLFSQQRAAAAAIKGQAFIWLLLNRESSSEADLEAK